MLSNDLKIIRTDLISKEVHYAHAALIEDVKTSTEVSLIACRNNIFEKLNYYIDQPIRKAFKEANEESFINLIIPSRFGSPLLSNSDSFYQSDFKQAVSNLDSWEQFLCEFSTSLKSTKSENIFAYLISLIQRIKHIRTRKIHNSQTINVGFVGTRFCQLCEKETQFFAQKSKNNETSPNRLSKKFCDEHTPRKERRNYDNATKYKKVADELLDSLISPSKYNFLPSMTWFSYQSPPLSYQDYRWLAFTLARSKLAKPKNQRLLMLISDGFSFEDIQQKLGSRVSRVNYQFNELEKELFLLIDNFKNRIDSNQLHEKVAEKQRLTQAYSLKDCLAQNKILSPVSMLRRDLAIKRVNESYSVRDTNHLNK